MPNNKEHDTLARRLSQILIMFNDGKRLSVDELAIEFAVNKRTIQRDLNRLSYLPIEKHDGCYFMEEYALGKLSYKDIQQFATFSGIQDLYPELSNELIVDILNVKTNKTIEVNGHKYEKLSHKVDDFNNIGGAIVTKNCISFEYSDKTREVNPYKLINTNGIWYLVGVEGGILKNFSFAKVDVLEVLEQTFKENSEVIKTLKEHKGVWFTQNCIAVEILVDSSVAHYFLRRDLLPNQKLVEHTDEHLILSTEVAYEEEMLKIVRYWIPHIKITSPDYLQEKLEESLKNYLSP